MKLLHFDGGRHSAAENMARDLLLLEAFPDPLALRLRTYAWEGDCFTFGYSQHRDWIAGQVPAGGRQLVRRPTGGGLVDHRNDWTYAFVVPQGHPLHRERADEVYRIVHQVLADAFTEAGHPAKTAPQKEVLVEGSARVQGLCFAAPEPYDVIDARTGTKIAGAAMKRNRHGVLLQGSVERSMLPGDFDWAAFRTQVIRGLAVRFGASACEAIAAPEPPEDALGAELARFQSPAWNARR